MTQTNKSKAIKTKIEEMEKDQALGFVNMLIQNVENQIASDRDTLKLHLLQMDYLKEIRDRVPPKEV